MATFKQFLQDDQMAVDPELSAIADKLREMSSYAINPIFKEELRKKLLQQFIVHQTAKTQPIEGHGRRSLC